MDVIVPTNGKRMLQLKECLISLSRQTQPVNVVVVLSIGAIFSPKKVEGLCHRYNCSLLLEPHKKVKGSHRAVACNFGLKNTDGKFVGFVDDDVSVLPTWAESSLKYFKDVKVAAVTSGCRLYSSSFHRIQSLGSDAHNRCFIEVTKVHSVPGYNSVYRRQALDDVGFFDESIGGCEDWELNYRLRKLGWLLYGVPEAPVEHRHRYSYRSFMRQMFDYGWSRARLWRVKRIFTVQHSLPLVGLLVFPFLFFNLVDLEFVLGFYFSGLSFLSIYVGAWGLRSFFGTVFAFVVMHVAWALGYLKGLLT